VDCTEEKEIKLQGNYFHKDNDDDDDEFETSSKWSRPRHEELKWSGEM
jgi:hypothetical protein